jgi:transposase
MGKARKVGGPATDDEIGAASQASRAPQERERLLAIRMGQQGEWTCEKIAHTVGRGRDTIVRGVRAYRQGGSHRLLARRDAGRRAQLSAAEQQALIEGVRRGPWKTAKDIRRGLQRERGLDLTLGGVYSWRHRLEARGKVPRKRPKTKTLPKKRPLHESLSPSEKPWPSRPPSGSMCGGKTSTGMG